MIVPDWDIERQWRCVAVTWLPDDYDDECCCPDRKVIEFCTLFCSELSPMQLLGDVVHHVCHARHIGHGHRGPWVNAMRDATIRARHVGLERLASLLVEETAICQED